MAEPLPLPRPRALARRTAAPALCLLLALPAAAGADAGETTLSAEVAAADSAADRLSPAFGAVEKISLRTPSYGPPGETPGIPADAELERSGAVIGTIIIDNQNIFNLDDPKDDVKVFRLANRLHIKTRERVIRHQLLFRPGERYKRRLLEESERILRADGYFYDAWIRPIRYHEGKVDLRVTTRDVWTLDPGFNFGRSGGTNTTGVQLEEINLLGNGTTVKVSHSNSIDRSTSLLQLIDAHAFGSWVSVTADYADQSDGRMRDLSVQQPFYSLDTHWAAGVYGLNDLQTDSLYDRGQIIDQFSDLHQGAQIFAGWSAGLQNGWVRRWIAGVTYDEHRFAPVSTWTGATDIPEDRRFLYPWLEFDLIEDDYLKFVNHDQIARTEDFYLGTSFSVRGGWADSSTGSSQSALILQSAASRGFRDGGSTLLLAWDFAGRVTGRELRNGVMDGSARYYLEETSNALFFTTLLGTKGWRLDLDDQILLGGDNGLRGYPLRYQDGTGRALWTVEQRYFTDRYPFRLFRVGGAVFFDAGRVWGSAPLAGPNLGLLKDGGFGLRFGNARSGLGNVIHVDVAFPLGAASGIKRAQFLVQTEQHF
ncbi:MAG: hypothetical protein JO173_10770 [Gammaproteobacteria bacterium]|nr:hypothetical protein [Gammaproteobacteria bacterium]